MDSALSEFGQKCRHYRLEKSRTIADQANALNISPVQICEIETGLQQPSIEYIKMFSRWSSLNFKEEASLIKLKQITKNFTIDETSEGVKLYRSLTIKKPDEIRKLREFLNVTSAIL